MPDRLPGGNTIIDADRESLGPATTEEFSSDVRDQTPQVRLFLARQVEQARHVPTGNHQRVTGAHRESVQQRQAMFRLHYDAPGVDTTERTPAAPPHATSLVHRTTRAGIRCSSRQVMLMGRLPSWRTYWRGPRKTKGAVSPFSSFDASRTKSMGV